MHMKDIHLEKGMHCIDCHFAQDGHGDGKLHGEYVNAIEITCIDCHGGVQHRATLRTSGIAAPEGGNDLAQLYSPWGQRRFVWRERDGRPVLLQRSTVTKDLEWEVVQVMDSIDPQSRHYNEKSRLAKTMQKDGKTWGSAPAPASALAHSEERMECFTCHLLDDLLRRMSPASTGELAKTVNHFEGDLTRNWTSYNPQGFGSTNLSSDSTAPPKAIRSPHCAHRVLWSSVPGILIANAFISSNHLYRHRAIVARRSIRTSRTPCAKAGN